MKHLSAEQIAQWMAGERTAAGELHVAGCERCHAEVMGFEDVLAQFRSSARSVNVPSPAMRAARSVMGPRWAAIAGVALLLLAPVYRERQARARRALELEDTQLLQQVDAEISRAVPGSMDPLVKMVSWNQNEAQK